MRDRFRHRRCVATVVLVGLVLACGGPVPGKRPAPAPASTSPGSLSTPAVATESRPRVVFLGDSLTAGYGLGEEEGFPARLGEALVSRGLAVYVVNAGVSGDTSAGGLARLDWLMQQRPRVVVIGLGANDGLRGLPLERTEANLREIVRTVRASGAEVLLLGMRIPPNYGADYAGAFAALYPRLARELDVPLVPFLLEGVAAQPELNQADGIHPTAEGQKLVAANVLPYLEPIVRRVLAR